MHRNQPPPNPPTTTIDISGVGPEGGNTPSRGEFNTMSNLVIGALVAVTVTVILLVIQYFTATQAAFINLGNEVTAQNAKIDTLIQLQQKCEDEGSQEASVFTP